MTAPKPAGMAGSAVATAGTGMVTAGSGEPPVAGSGDVMAPDAGGTAGMGPTAGSMSTENGCLDGITNYFDEGPFTFEQTSSGRVNFWVPAVPAGCKVPVIHLANGTGASCATYNASLSRMASHGFLACCYESTNTGAGDQGVEALETAFAEYADIADMKIGSTGHSQGGQASFTVLSLAEDKWGDSAIYAGLAMQPASGFGAQPTSGSWQSLYATINSPFFMFSGLGTDGLVSQGWVQSAFDALDDSVEAYFWAKSGGTHIPVPNGEEMQISIAWFRWKLLGDQEACRAFKGIPMMDSTWVVVDEKNQGECL
jgi:hypothetical protein